MTVPTLVYGGIPRVARDRFVAVDLDRLVAGRLLVQANSGGGKSWALRQFLEQTFGAVPHIVLDPEGEFYTLRERFDYILGAKAGRDFEVSVRTAKVLVRRIVEQRANAILDLYEWEPKVRRAIVRIILTELVQLPRALWTPYLVVLDEAHQFAPERGHGEAESTDAVINLASLGRKRGFALVAATQRISKLHKDVAAECNTRLIGRTALDVDVKRAGDELGMSKESRAGLPHLAPGTFYAFGPALSEPGVVLVKSGDVTTTHPEPGALAAAAPAPSSKVKRLLAEALADLPAAAEEEARTLDDLRRQNAELQRKLRAAEKGAAVVHDERATQRAVQAATADATKTITTLRRALEAAVKLLVTINTQGFDAAGVSREDVQQALEAAVAQATKLAETRFAARERELAKLRTDAGRILAQLRAVLGADEVAVEVTVTKQEAFAVAPAPTRAEPRARTTTAAPRERSTESGDVSLPPGERAVLTAAAQYPEGVDRDQLSILTGYKRSSRNTYINRLTQRGFVRVEGETIVATDDGVAALGADFTPLPTGAALRDYWLARLTGGEQRILEVLIEAYPDAVAREAIDDATGYKRSSRNTYITRLAARRLVATGADGVRAHANLFDRDGR